MPGPGGRPGAQPGRARGCVIGAFNGGFKLSAHVGGYEQAGAVISPLVPGRASLVIYRSGAASIGDLGSRPAAAGEAGLQRQAEPGPAGSPRPANRGVRWRLGRLGRRRSPVSQNTARSALGENASGQLIYVASMSATPGRSRRRAGAGGRHDRHGTRHQRRMGPAGLRARTRRPRSARGSPARSARRASTSGAGPGTSSLSWRNGRPAPRPASAPSHRARPGRQPARMSARLKLTGSSSWPNPQDAGSRSGRQRTNCAVCRNLVPSMWSYLTSTTRSGRSGTNDRSLPAFQRLPSASRGCRVAGLGVRRPVPRMAVEAGHQRLQLGEQRLARRHRERADDADAGQVAVVVVQAEQQRADRVSARSCAAGTRPPRSRRSARA